MTLATRLLLRVYKKVVIQSARKRKRFTMPIQFYASHGSRKGFVNDFLALPQSSPESAPHRTANINCIVYCYAFEVMIDNRSFPRAEKVAKAKAAKATNN